MATKTVGQIIDRALKKADQYGSNFIDPDFAIDLFNECYSELYDILVSRFEDYFIKSPDYTFSISNVTNTYSLPSDLYKVVGVDFATQGSGSNRGFITLRAFTQTERNNFFGGVFSALPSGTIRLRYVPLPVEATSRDDTYEDFNGYLKYVSDLMAMYMLQKEESSTAVFERAIQKMERRVQEMAQNRDIGMPARVNDMTVIDFTPQWANLRYHIQGNDIVFLARELVDLTYWLY